VIDAAAVVANLDDSLDFFGKWSDIWNSMTKRLRAMEPEPKTRSAMEVRMRNVLGARRRSDLIAGAILLMGLAPGAASGEAQDARLVAVEPVATFAVEGQTLTFAPKVPDGLMLTVSGPLGFLSSREFPAGAQATFVLVAANGPLPDGRYKYELRTQPQVDQQLMAIAQESGDERLQQELDREEQTRVKVQAGQFDVVGGTAVKPALELESNAFGHYPPVQPHTHGDDTHTHDGE
jgi:hypothetical protein